MKVTIDGHLNPLLPIGSLFRDPGPYRDLFANLGPYWVFISSKRSLFLKFLYFKRVKRPKVKKSCKHLKGSKFILSEALLVYKASKYNLGLHFTRTKRLQNYLGQRHGTKEADGNCWSMLIPLLDPPPPLILFMSLKCSFY